MTCDTKRPEVAFVFRVLATNKSPRKPSLVSGSICKASLHYSDIAPKSAGLVRTSCLAIRQAIGLAGTSISGKYTNNRRLARRVKGKDAWNKVGLARIVTGFSSSYLYWVEQEVLKEDAAAALIIQQLCLCTVIIEKRAIASFSIGIVGTLFRVSPIEFS
jgi:hypothetical protein